MRRALKLNRPDRRNIRNFLNDDQYNVTSVDCNMDKYITIDGLGSNGRLGNQLFQVASTIGIAIKNNVRPVFKSWYCTYTKKDMSVYFKDKLEYIEKINPSNRYLERYFNYHEIRYLDNMSIKGYYQSEKYFSHCEEDIRFYFQPSDNLSYKINEIYKNMVSENKKTCSIHIRRGDYVNNPFHEVCDYGYYTRAIEKIDSLLDIDFFIIFSDDINWCKNTFKGERFLYSEGLEDIEDLFLMSSCDNHIISNSSFSWWGSWLCNKQDKKIITPSRWFKDSSVDDRDIFPNNCIKI
jgi:hypothetical protein